MQIEMGVVATSSKTVEFAPEDSTVHAHHFLRLPRRAWIAMGAPYFITITVDPAQI